ncbi:MAG: hypothetical protein P8Y44_08460 [Acidobacteriota bacterium]
MARIKTMEADETRGIRRALVWHTVRQYGYLPGIFKVLLPDMGLARHTGALYNHLHLRKGSPLSRLQREMVAVIVNGAISGAP